MIFQIPLADFNKETLTWGVSFSERFELNHKNIKSFAWIDDLGDVYTYGCVEYNGDIEDIARLIVDGILEWDQSLSFSTQQKIASTLYDLSERNIWSRNTKGWWKEYKAKKSKILEKQTMHARKYEID